MINMKIISWGMPIPYFGNINNSQIASLGINPSNREFVDVNGKELSGDKRRFHTLKSLRINSWEELNDYHIDLMINSCINYFCNNPYDRWFKEIDLLLSGTSFSYYTRNVSSCVNNACHLDLIPFATIDKWGYLSENEKNFLLNYSGDVLGVLLRDSPIKYMLLNGKSVIDNFSKISDVNFQLENMSNWALPRKNKKFVSGVSYIGTAKTVSGVDLGKEIKVLGYNHNIQSSFGVTKKVKFEISQWIAQNL